MAKKLSNLSEEELVELQIDLSNKRAGSDSKYKAEALEVQAAIDEGRVRAKFDRLSDAEKDTFRELLDEESGEDG